MLVIYGTMDDRLPHVHEEDERQDGKGDTGPVAREADVEVPVALVGSEGSPPSGVGRFHGESALLLAQPWDVLVDLHLQLGCDVVALDHVHYLALLLIDVRETWSDLRQVLVKVVLHIL